MEPHGAHLGVPQSTPKHKAGESPKRGSALPNNSFTVSSGGSNDRLPVNLFPSPSVTKATSCCANCGTSGSALFICPCELVYYCSSECQQTHWSTHSVTCRHGLSSARELTSCEYCLKESTDNMWCQCGTLQYCSRECQRAHWRARHSSECTPFYRHSQRVVKKKEVKESNTMADRFLDIINKLRQQQS